MTLTLHLLTLAGIGYLALKQRRHHHEVLDRLHGTSENVLSLLDAALQPAEQPAGAHPLDVRVRDVQRAHADGIADAASRVRRFADVRTQAHGLADDKAITLRGLASHLEGYAQRPRS